MPESRKFPLTETKVGVIIQKVKGSDGERAENRKQRGKAKGCEPSPRWNARRTAPEPDGGNAVPGPARYAATSETTRWNRVFYAPLTHNGVRGVFVLEGML